jgi:ferredoxin
MRVSADSQTCAVSSLCVYRVPQVFDQDKEEGTVVVINPQPPPELHEAVLSAERACPTRSIHVDKA